MTDLLGIIVVLATSIIPQGLFCRPSPQIVQSPEYNPEKKHAAQARGGKAQVAKGFAKLSREKLREVARKGGLA